VRHVDDAAGVAHVAARQFGSCKDKPAISQALRLLAKGLTEIRGTANQAAEEGHAAQLEQHHSGYGSSYVRNSSATKFNRSTIWRMPDQVQWQTVNRLWTDGGIYKISDRPERWSGNKCGQQQPVHFIVYSFLTCRVLALVFLVVAAAAVVVVCLIAGYFYLYFFFIYSYVYISFASCYGFSSSS